MFALGYYYTLLQKVVDVSRLAVAEVYGSWKWDDIALLSYFEEIVHTNVKDDPNGSPAARIVKREGLLKRLALLMAVSDPAQLSSFDANTIGVHGKISVVASSLSGAINSRAQVARFCLLDTDSTAIPSNTKGIVKSGGPVSGILAYNHVEIATLRALNEVDPAGLGSDFTSHIEPDWENDIQLCQIVFRYKGRFINRLQPVMVERAWAKHTTKM